MSVPNDLMYTKSHEWVKLMPGGRARMGITDHAQQAMGDLDHVLVAVIGFTKRIFVHGIVKVRDRLIELMDQNGVLVLRAITRKLNRDGCIGIIVRLFAGVIKTRTNRNIHWKRSTCGSDLLDTGFGLV